MIGRILALALLTFGPPALAEEAAGEWWVPGLKARVLVEPCAGHLCGKVSWLLPPGILPAGEEPPAAILGRRIFRLAPHGARPGRFRGRIDNPEDGQGYDGEVALLHPDWLELKGCVFFLCRSQLWMRHRP